MAATAGVNEGSAPELPRLVPTEPVTAEPVTAEPVTAEPVPVELVTAEPVPAEPAAPVAAAPEAASAAEPAMRAESARPPRRGGAVGTAVLVLGIVVLAGVAAGGVAVLTHGFHRKTVVSYRPAAVFGLQPGECVNFGPNEQAVTALSCATPHDAEVFARFTLPASPWPGGAAVQQDASDGCASRLGGYLNPELANAGLDQEYFYPDQTGWLAGARTVVCAVRAPTGQLTGSVRGAG